MLSAAGRSIDPARTLGLFREARKRLFFEKKKQKTSTGCRGLSFGTRVENQPFLVLLLCLPAQYTSRR
jgi:hypothetical protein